MRGSHADSHLPALDYLLDELAFSVAKFARKIDAKINDRLANRETLKFT